MATVLPFEAVRPENGLEEIIAALPYDVYSREEAREIVLKNPDSFLKIDRAETRLPDSVDTYDPEVYKMALKLYEEMKSEGKLKKDNVPQFYIYSQTMNGRTQTGIVGCASVNEYNNGIVKKHENTRKDKEKDRIDHVYTVSAQTGPIFLAYKDYKPLTDFIRSFIENEAPYADFTTEQKVRQRLWAVSENKDISFIEECFKNIDNLYIADGHHRCASACRVAEIFKTEGKVTLDADYFLSVIFPDSDLYIMDYNRIIRDLNGLSEQEFIEKVKEHFNVSPIEMSFNKPGRKNTVYMIFKDKEYEISLKEEYISDDPIKTLDVSVLQDHIFAPILGIDDPKTDKRIDFIGGIRGVEELVRRLSEDAVVAFSMYPTSMEELFNVADAGLLMPPKSTWFEPKLLSGLFIHEI